MKPAPQTASQSHDIARRLDYLGLDEAALKRLRTLKPFIEKELGPALDKFYTIVRKSPEVSGLFSNEAHINRAKTAQIGHWANIATGDFTGDYASKVQTIGQVHARIGLEPRWYIGGYALIVEHLLTEAVKSLWPKPGFFTRPEIGPDEFSARFSIASPRRKFRNSPSSSSPKKTPVRLPTCPFLTFILIFIFYY